MTDLMVAVVDLVDPARHAVVPAENAGAIVAEWIRLDGGSPSKNVARLVAALRRGDWTAVHRIASFLSVDVDVAAGVL